MHTQEILNEYFSKHWTSGNQTGASSPREIIKKIDPHEWLLDVGCGKNPFKSVHPRTIGIDPVFHEADYRCTIEEFKPTGMKFDVATVLGSINFGTTDVIELQISKLVNCLKPTSRVYWRLNPGRADHGTPYANNIVFFNWSFELLKQFAAQYNFKQTVELLDEHPTRPRLYAEWCREVS